MTDERQHSPGGEQGGAEAPAKPRARRAPHKRPPRLLPPWKVLLHNDDVNTVQDVIRIVRQLTSLNEQDAIDRVREANDSGLALLLVTHRERAELYVEQFTSMGLTTTCEPDA